MTDAKVKDISQYWAMVAAVSISVANTEVQAYLEDSLIC